MRTAGCTVFWRTIPFPVAIARYGEDQAGGAAAGDGRAEVLSQQSVKQSGAQQPLGTSLRPARPTPLRRGRVHG